MDPIMALGAIATIYGFAGICGLQYIPKVYRNRSFSKEFARAHGRGWLLVGLLWSVAAMIRNALHIENSILLLLLLVCASFPAILYDTYVNQKYLARLSAEVGQEVRTESRRNRGGTHTNKKVQNKQQKKKK